MILTLHCSMSCFSATSTVSFSLRFDKKYLLSSFLSAGQQLTDTIPGSVFLLSRGIFSCPSNLLPWRCSSSGIYKKSHRRAPSSESVPGLERLLKAWALTESQGPNSTGGLQGPLDPYEPVMPLLMWPCMSLWKECYLRGALHAQVCRECGWHYLITIAGEAGTVRRAQQKMRKRTRVNSSTCVQFTLFLVIVKFN